MKRSSFRLSLRPRLLTSIFAIITLTHYGCGTKNNTSSDSGASTGISASDGNTPDATTAAAPPASPTAADIASNSQSLSQVASSGLDSATSAAAAGAGGAGSTAGLVSEDDQNFLDIPAQPTETVAKTTGSQAQDCYLGSTIANRSITPPATVVTPMALPPTWPEQASTSTSVFANSKNDTTTAANMYVEPALLQYPATSPTATLTLSVPFTIANMIEVVQSDNRTVTDTLADKAATVLSQSGNYEEHRFWVAKNPITGASSAAMKCSPLIGTGSTGSSNASNGTVARIKWTDTGSTGQINGLNMLGRQSSNVTVSKKYYPKVKGVLATTKSTLTWNRIANGQRLVQWTTSTAAAAAVTNATVVYQKQITHYFTRSDIQKDTAGTAVTTLTGTDEVRASAPLVIQEYRSATESVLAHVIASGTINRTGTDTSGAVKWFTTFAYNNVKFDYQNSTEACIPVSGSVTLTVYDKEGGTQAGQVTITYSSSASTLTTATSGQVDPSIVVSGDDADSTRAQWMMLNVNRRCDVKNL